LHICIWSDRIWENLHNGKISKLLTRISQATHFN
jgi:hypothetical protein